MVAKGKLKFLLLLALMISCFSLFAESADTAALNKRNKFIETAKQFLGVPYVYGGTSRSGIDCSGLVFLAGKGIGLSLPRTASQICDFSRIIEDSERQAGDLLFFSDNGSKVTHVAIYLGDGKMIHAASSGIKTGVIISEVTESYWKRTYYCAGRIIDPVTALADNSSSQGNQGSASSSSGLGSINKPEEESDQGSIPPGGIVIATVNKQDKENRTSESSNGGHSSPFFDKIALDFSFAGGWSLFTTEKFGPVFRGLNAQAVATYGTGSTKPGVGAAFNWDPSMNICQLIFTLSFIANEHIRIYAGPVITMGSPVLPGTNRRIESSIFPGILGVSFQTPTIQIGKAELHFCQDFVLTVFNKTDGAALPIGEAAAANLSLQTGIRVTIPHL